MPVRAGEGQDGVGIPDERPSKFVYRFVMTIAECHEVVEIRLASLGPMSDVVNVGELGENASWESASFVAASYLYPLGGRRISPSSTLVEYASLPRFDGQVDIGVAGQSPEDLGLHRPQLGDLGHPGLRRRSETDQGARRSGRG